MKTFHKTIRELVDDGGEDPFPVSFIPNFMGINLVSVEAVTWTKLDDGQLVSITIHFKPDVSR